MKLVLVLVFAARSYALDTAAAAYDAQQKRTDIINVTSAEGKFIFHLYSSGVNTTGLQCYCLAKTGEKWIGDGLEKSVSSLEWTGANGIYTINTDKLLAMVPGCKVYYEWAFATVNTWPDVSAQWFGFPAAKPPPPPPPPPPSKEYNGFVHISAWKGGVTELDWFKDPNAEVLTWNFGLRQDLCSSSLSCNALWSQADKLVRFRNRTTDPNYDIYLGVDATVLPAKICVLHRGAATQQHYFPDDVWVLCHNADHFDGMDTFLASFNLPPHLIHNACLENPQCIGFRIKNDLTSGDLLKAPPSQSVGSFRLSH